MKTLTRLSVALPLASCVSLAMLGCSSDGPGEGEPDSDEPHKPDKPGATETGFFTCEGSGDTVPFQGTLTGFGGESGRLAFELAPDQDLPDGAIRGGATVTITLLGGETIAMSGRYGSDELELAGGGYTMTASLDPDRAVGRFEGPKGQGSFAALCGREQDVVVYCGTAALEDFTEPFGLWNLVREDDQLTGSYTTEVGEAGHFIGDIDADGQLALEFDISSGETGTAQGVLSGDDVSGTWEFPALTGTWAGSSTACE